MAHVFDARVLAPLFMLGTLIVAVAPATAQDDMAGVEIETTRVADGVYMLTGQGGNIGLSTGDDGAILIDDQFAPLSEKIIAAVGEVTDKPIRFVLNTHLHGDHTGGNENMGRRGALIVAHENVRKRMSMERFVDSLNQSLPATPPGAWPVVTFTDSLSFHWNGDEINVFHVAPAHTDGDVIIHFTGANVFHMGDTYFNGFYPFIDAASGGSIDGVIVAVDRVLAIADDDAQIIPGHGPLSNKADLADYRDMLATVRDRIRALINAGQTVDEVVAAEPTKEFDEAWGNGFMEPEDWVRLVYSVMIR